MGRPITLDIRRSIVTNYHNGVGTIKEMAAIYGVGEATVNRLLRLQRETGSVEPKKMGGARRKRLVDEVGEEFIRQKIEQLPDLSLPELSELYLAEFSVKVAPQRMSETLRRMGISKKKRAFVH